MRGLHHYIWLEEPWRDAFVRIPDRRLLVAALYDKDYRLRDAYAHEILCKCLTGRSDVRYEFARAYGIGPPGDPPPAGDDFLFLGRAKPYTGSLWGEVAMRLEGRMCGRFLDPTTGLAADTIRYGKRQFTRREIDGSTPQWRRCDRDYAVFMYREEEVTGDRRRLAALAGLGSLGTLLLTAALAHPPLRRQLACQARAIAPLTVRHRPNEWVEVLIGFRLRDHTYLDGLLARLEEVLSSRSTQSLTEIFEAKVEVVAVSTGNDTCGIYFNDVPDIHLELRPFGDGRRGGLLRRLDTNRAIKLPPLRAALLRELARAPEQATVEALCRVRAGERDRRGTQGALRKLVHNLNNDLERLLDARPIRFDRKLHRYICDGVRVVWHPQPDA